MSVCMQKPSLYFFLEIFQRNSKLAILGNLGMPGKQSINLKLPFMFINRLKTGFIFHVFFQILQGYYKLIILPTLRMIGYIAESVIINL